MRRPDDPQIKAPSPTDRRARSLVFLGLNRCELVGRTRFELVTSSVSGKRSPAELTALNASPRCYQSQLPSARRQGHPTQAPDHARATPTGDSSPSRGPNLPDTEGSSRRE